MSASLALQPGRGLPMAVAGTFAIFTLLAAGCAQGTAANSQTEPPAETPTPPRTAAEVLLKRVEEAYHKADRYQDSGRLVVQYVREGKTFNETSKFSLAMSGPNRLRMEAYDVLVVCDGQTFWATIDTAPGEVLSVAAPEELSPALVYRDPVLGKALNQIVGSVPLSLFLDPEPLPGFQYNAQLPQLDSPQKIGDQNCYRVRIARREGALVLWIDERTLVVRRVEYPSDGYRQLVEPYPGAVTGMTITAELDDARLDPPIDDATFQFDVPKGAELVKQFDYVLVGGRIPKFKLRALDGRLITRESLAGKIAVLKFWQIDDVVRYHDDLSSFEEVRRRFQDQDSVVFLTVTADPDEISDADLEAAFAAANLSLPIARVSLEVAFRSFGLQYVPLTVILGPDGTLQEHALGSDPDQAKTLPKKLDTLLAGGDLVLEAPERPPEYSYFGGLAFQSPLKPEDEQQPALADALAKAEIAPPSEPKLLRLKQLWSCSKLEQPGNILVAHEDAERDRVFVIDGPSSVAEIGAQGKVSAKHRLDLPGRDAAITFLRSATDASGNRYFVGSKVGAKQLYLFDAGWERLLSYPEDVDHPGISDAALADLDEDGNLEMLVGYLAAVGVHCVALDGERLWRNRAAENVLRLGVTSPDRRGQRQLLVAQGLLLPINADGSEQPPILLPDAFVRLIFTADLDGDESSQWCAIALKSQGPDKLVRDTAVGLSPRGRERWKYPLPEGMHHHPAFEMVASGNLLGGEAGQWVIAGADGSIHILASDGSLIDRFNYGAAPSGMAIANLDGRPALLVSTDDALEAWQIELPPQDEEGQE